ARLDLLSQLRPARVPVIAREDELRVVKRERSRRELRRRASLQARMTLGDEAERFWIERADGAQDLASQRLLLVEVGVGGQDADGPGIGGHPASFITPGVGIAG